MAKGRGRPTDYNPKLADTICQRIALGASVRAIGLDPDMPTAASIWNWVARHQEFFDKYMRARKARMDLYGEEIVEIADDADEDVLRSRLKVETRKWLMGKLAPKRYGDALDVKHSGSVRVNVFKDD